jgi:hypothetical protein
LRRTGRTGLAKLGVNKDVAERILNHVREDMVGVYDTYDYLDEKRAALQKWSNYLKSLVTRDESEFALQLKSESRGRSR